MKRGLPNGYHILPEKMPCGCKTTRGTKDTNNNSFVLYDGTRICKVHSRRFKLIFIEIKLGDLDNEK